jgi:hypothetical protein
VSILWLEKRGVIMTEKIDEGIANIVGALVDPIIVVPGGWGDTLPDWIKNAITQDRLIMNIKGAVGEKMTGTDSEACAYLYTLSLTQPMSDDLVKIYLYVATKCIGK